MALLEFTERGIYCSRAKVYIDPWKPVDYAIISIDKDRTVCKSIEKLVNDYSDKYDFTFANGGDQDNNSIPEAPICQQLGVDLLDGLGDKIQSSSWLLKK